MRDMSSIGGTAFPLPSRLVPPCDPPGLALVDLFDGEGDGGGGALPSADGKFRRLVESSADAIIVVWADGAIAWANPAAGRLFNRPFEAMPGEPFGLPLVGSGVTQVDILPRGRAPRVAEMRVSETSWEGRVANRVSLRDVTDQIRMERSLNLASIVFNQAAEGIAFADDQLRFVEANAAFAEFFGKTAKALVGCDLTSVFFTEDDRDDGLIDALRALGPGQRLRREFRLGGVERYALVSAVQVAEESFASHYVLLCTDISRQKHDQHDLRHEARHDALTGLANRGAFLEMLRAAIARANRHGRALAVMYLDLDGFKVINDEYGHEHGDRVLEAVARRMRSVVRSSDSVARMGGDEFTLLIEDVEQPGDVTRVAEKLREVIESPIQVGGEALSVGTSIGASLYPLNGDDPATLLGRADLALYRVKEFDPGGFRFFNPHMDRRGWLEREKAGRLAAALRSGSLQLVFQPQVDIETGAVHSVEALLRFQGPSVGWRRPNLLVELAERAGLLPELLHWVLGRAMTAARDWPGAPPVAINLCTRQLLVEDLDRHLIRVAEEVGFPPSRLMLHLPVSGVMAHPDRAARLADRLRRAGVRICLDNFGKGAFSIASLESMAPDGVCIDRSVIAGMRDIPERRLTLRAMLAMLGSMEMTVVVQGVERVDQIQWLRRMAGGLLVQGEHVAAPLGPDEIRHWLASRD